MNICASARNVSKLILHWVEGYYKCFSQILWTNIKISGKLPAANHSKAQKSINNTV